MLASTFLSILFIPLLYVVIRSLAPGKVTRSEENDHGGQVVENGGAHA
jgi:hypothetical protein